MKLLFFVLLLTASFFTARPAHAVEPVTLHHSNDDGNEDLCPSVFMNICGVTFTTPPGVPGTMLNFTLPERFLVRNASVQCVSKGGTAYYNVIDNAVLACNRRVCAQSTVSLCDHQINVEEKTAVGDAVKISVPTTLLADRQNRAVPIMTAQCVISDSTPQYKIVDDGGISCSDFLCSPAELKICGASVIVDASSAIGTVINMETANKHPVRVECIGQSGHAPRYVISDFHCN